MQSASGPAEAGMGEEGAFALASPETLRQFADAIGAAVFVVAVEPGGVFRIELVNRHYEREFRVAAGDLVGRRLGDVLPQEDAERVARRYAACVAAGERVAYEETLDLPSGRFVSRTTLLPLSAGGRVVRLVGTAADITEHRRLSLELAGARDRAEAASRSKSDFLANMSHELRTPLNAIIGFSEIIAQEMFGPVGNEAYRDYAGDVHFAGRHLLDIVNDMLDMARADAGRIALDEAETPLEALFAEVAELLEQRAGKSRVRPTVLPAPAGLLLACDRRLLRQALLNVVGNAVKFTEGGGRAELAAHVLADGQLCFTVSDTGIGIGAADLPVALAPFGRVASPTKAEHEGTGLGLPLARAMIELHGGQLFINSRLGSGTTVFLTLPAGRLSGADGRPPATTIGGLREFFAVDGRPLGETADRLDARALDALPIGAILLDAAGRVLRYNAAEGRFAGTTPEAVLGRDFFRDVAPCTFTPEFHGRFRDGLAGGSLSAIFSYVFRFARESRKVLIEMRAGEAAGTVWLFIRWV